MAYKYKQISNPKTGQAIKFLQTANDTGGKLLEMEASFSPHSKEPVAHYHPYQEENFIVLSGQLTVRMDAQLQLLKQGDTLHIPKNKVHSMWNDSDRQATVNWKVQPAMNTEYFFETAMGLAMDGKTNEQGMPGILQIALMVNKYSRVYRPAKPPFAVQKILFTALSPFAYLLGYKPVYKKYLD